MPAKKTQADKFKEAARKLGADENEARWKERLRKIVRRDAANDPDKNA